MVRDIRNLLPLTPEAKSDWRRERLGGATDVGAIAIHYMGKESFYPAANASVQDEINQAKMIHQYHISIGYGGIGYQGLAFESARSYMTSDYNRWGAAVKGRNDDTLSFAGMFGGHVVPSEGIQNGLADLIDHADQSYLGRPLRPIKGHRAFVPTDCPGNPYLDWVTDLRDLLAEPEDDMSVADVAKYFRDVEQKFKAGTPLTPDEKELWAWFEALTLRTGRDMNWGVHPATGSIDGVVVKLEVQ